MKRYLLPLAVFLVLLGFLAVGLQRDPREVPSPLVGRPAPAFALPVLGAPDRTVSAADLRGQVWMLNVWASWCGACRLEHPVMVDLARSRVVPIYGLNYKDKPAEAIRWLGHFGNPYQQSLSDADGRVGIDFGVYGVPETFVIDKAGVVRLKLTGPVTPEMLKETILPLIGRLNG